MIRLWWVVVVVILAGQRSASLLSSAEAAGTTSTSSSDSSSSWYSSWFTSISSSSSDNGENEDTTQDDDEGYDDQLKSPLLNRELTTVVKAHAWPTVASNALCETLGFFQQEDAILETITGDSLVTQFLNELTSRLVMMEQQQQPAPSDFSKSVEWVLELVESSPWASTYASLLQWSLQLRANSPLCEVHRGLARQTFQQSSSLLEIPNDILMVVLSKTPTAQHQVFTTLDEIQQVDWTRFTTNMNEHESAEAVSLDQYLLSGELPLAGTGNATTSDALVILYGNLDSLVFAQTHQHLKPILEARAVPFVVRFLGVVNYEENPASAQPTTLAGYGVRLDIRNVEYKVFDESKKTYTEDEQDIVMVNLTKDDSSLFAHEYLAGVNLTQLLRDNDNDNDTKENIMTVRNRLWHKHERLQAQAQKIPPLWQRRKLPLQAATVLLQQHYDHSSDVLVTLTQLSQDLPSVASTLVQVKIWPALYDWASAISRSAELRRSVGLLYVNGRPFPVNGPTFNVFELLSVIRMEQRRVQHLQTSVQPLLHHVSSPSLALSRIQQAWISGSDFGEDLSKTKPNDDDDGSSEEDDDEEMESSSSSSTGASATVYRVDVGRGWKQAIWYVNDVEKDMQYRKWPRNLQQMLMSMQFGMAPSVRRNIYTMTMVMGTSPHSPGLDLAMKLVQNQYPARLGLLFVDDQDVESCKSWLQQQQTQVEDDVPCPVEPYILEKGESLVETKATARAVHRLMNHFDQNYASQPGASLAYLEYFFSFLSDQIGDGETASLQDVINVHTTLLSEMSLGMPSSIEKEAQQVLFAAESEVQGATVYGKTLRFAAERGLRSGMSFLNGRPLPSTEEGVHAAFTEEQKYMMSLIVSGEINDQAPRSIYGKVLSGPNVFSQMHPLLLQDEKNSPIAYMQLQHSWSPSSLLLMKQQQSPIAYFVMDVVLDYATPRGLAQLENILQSMQQFPTLLNGDSNKAVSIGYRFLPSSQASADTPLCPILANAGSIALEALQGIVKTVAASDSDPKTLQDLLSGVNAATKELVLSSQETCQSSGLTYLMDGPLTPRVICNGRVYEMGDDNLAKEDIDLLLSIGKQRATAVYGMLLDLIPNGVGPAQVAQTVAGVSVFLALEQAKKSKRENVMKAVHAIEKRLKLDDKDGLMRFQWNESTKDDDDTLKSRVIAVLDPVHVSTQRLAPLLEIMRDQLGLPLTVILAPPPSIDGDVTVPVTSYYRFVGSTPDASMEPMAHFSALPLDHVLTLRMDVPEPWDVQQTLAIQDTDNLRCDLSAGCGDDAHERGTLWTPASIKSNRQITKVEYGLSHLLVFGQCYEKTGPPNGLQLVLSKNTQLGLSAPSSIEAEFEVSMDGETTMTSTKAVSTQDSRYSDTLVMKNVGYWQLRANPGLWEVKIEEKSKGAEIFDFIDSKMERGRLVEVGTQPSQSKQIVLKDFSSRGELLYVKRRKGYERASLFFDGSSTVDDSDDGVIHVFSLATGHLYERFLKIMMLSVTKRTSSKVKFWLFENFLSPTFKDTSRAMASRIGCEVEFVTYKWPEWLRGQTEKQRIIWGYKILFLDVLFPLSVKKIIYVDADQVVRADLKELWDMDLKGAPYGYTPFCSSRETTIGYQFWRDGFWKTHLQGRPYHISALYVVDLKRFREELVGDQLRSIYQQLSADPNSLANLDQDLPNYAQHQVRIFSLPQDWLWCESWCSDETKATSKTIDLCNNPLHKEPKVSMAKRIIDGPLFNESWVQLDAEVERYEKEYLSSMD